MALFEISSQEKSSISNWVKDVHMEIKAKADIKCSEYGFNFFEGLPYKSSEKYEWDSVDAENKEFYRLTTRSTITSRSISSTYLDDPEEILEIPEL